jgi:hypothetical protein
MNFETVFKYFGSALNERLERNVPTTEDSVRYTFFYAILQENSVSHTDIVLEYPHPALSGAEIDTLIGLNTAWATALEFKFDRGNPGGTNQNRTQRAAAVLNDIFRLARVPSNIAARKFFIYVTDIEMASYFSNPVNRLCEFYGVCGDIRFALGQSLLNGAPKTLAGGIERLLIDCQVAGIFSMELARKHAIRVFEVFAV